MMIQQLSVTFSLVLLPSSKSPHLRNSPPCQVFSYQRGSRPNPELLPFCSGKSRSQQPLIHTRTAAAAHFSVSAPQKGEASTVGVKLGEAKGQTYNGPAKTQAQPCQLCISPRLWGKIIAMIANLVPFLPLSFSSQPTLIIGPV